MLAQLKNELEKVIPTDWHVEIIENDRINVRRGKKVLFHYFEQPGYIEPRGGEAPKIDKPRQKEDFIYSFWTRDKYISPADYQNQKSKNEDIETQLVEYSRFFSPRRGREKFGPIQPLYFTPKNNFENQVHEDFSGFYTSNIKAPLPDCHYDGLSFTFLPPRCDYLKESAEIIIECHDVFHSISNVFQFYEGNWQKYLWFGKRYYLRISGTQIPLIFQQEIDQELKYEIERDVNRIYYPGKDFRFYKRTPREVKFFGKSYTAHEKLHVTGGGIQYPAAFYGCFGDVISINGRRHLLVSQELIGKFQKAQQFFNSNGAIFSELRSLITAAEQATKKHPLSGDQDNWVWSRTNYRHEMWYMNYAGITIRYPSILDYQVADPEIYGDDIKFVVSSFALDEKTRRVERVINFVYHKNKWKFEGP